MQAGPKLPRVGVNFGDGEQFWYLVERGGRKWAYLREQDAGKPPHQAGALVLDPARLELDSVGPDGVQIFRYRLTFGGG